MMGNLRAAAAHPSVRLVLAVTGDHEETNQAIEAAVADMGPRVRISPQQRLGTLRSGKGDAINTGFQMFLNNIEFERIHFYDADIKTFDGDWITKAETALDHGYQAVRHFYPRAATDAMITWMVTRLGFACPVGAIATSNDRAAAVGGTGLQPRSRGDRCSRPEGEVPKRLGGRHRDNFREHRARSLGLRVVYRPRQGSRPLWIIDRHQGDDGRVSRRFAEAAFLH